MDATDPFVRRHGLKPKRSRGGPWLFLFGIGAIVGGLGAAGLYYGRPDKWDHHVPSSPVATDTPVPSIGTAEVTSAEMAPIQSTLGARVVPAETQEEPKVEAPKPAPARVRAPPPKKAPAAETKATNTKEKETTEKEKEAPSEDPFSTVH